MDINHNEKWQQEMCYLFLSSSKTNRYFPIKCKELLFLKRRRKKEERLSDMILQKNIATNYESNAIWKKWMKILQRIKLQHSKYGTEVANTVSLLCSLKSSKEINTKSLWFIWAYHRDETEHGESKNKNF